MDVTRLAEFCRRWSDLGRIRAHLAQSSALTITLTILVLSTLAGKLIESADNGLPWGRHVAVSEVRREENTLAYVGRLSNSSLTSRHRPSPGQLYLITEKPVPRLRWMENQLGTSSYLVNWFVKVYQRRFGSTVAEDWLPISPGNSLHDDIRRIGDGRYSIWDGHLIFSYPKGMQFSPSHRFVVLVPWFRPAQIRSAVNLLWNVSLLAAGLAALLILSRFISPRMISALRGLAKEAGPGLLISGALIIGLAAAGELYHRFTTPFVKSVMPLRNDSRIGVHFEPNQIVKFTNGSEFWVEHKSNSLGFLDHEPAMPKPPNRFRVLIVGDSFVEALQVPLRLKLQTLLAEMLKRTPEFKDLDLDVVALGYSGTGQANQLAFYEAYRKDMKPDAVFLLFVSNDFANNSIVLEAVRQNFDPARPPHMFLELDGRRLSADSNWLSGRLKGQGEIDRIQELSARSEEIGRLFKGWNPAQMHMDNMFYQEQMPAVFEQAVNLTRTAIGEWKKLASADRFQLAVVATDTLGLYGGNDPNNLQIKRLKQIAADLDVPLIDLLPHFLKNGGSHTARFRFDGHWNDKGHRLAAEVIHSYLQANIKPRRP